MDDETFLRRHEQKEQLEKSGKRFDVLAEERRRQMLLAEALMSPIVWQSKSWFLFSPTVFFPLLASCTDDGDRRPQ